jgi:hypothetical protein
MKTIFIILFVLFTHSLTFAATYETFTNDIWSKAFVLKDVKPIDHDVYNINHEVRLVKSEYVFASNTVMNLNDKGILLFNNTSLVFNTCSTINVSRFGRFKRVDGVNGLPSTDNSWKDYIDIKGVRYNVAALEKYPLGGYSLTCPQAPLPVTLIGFDVMQDNERVDFVWDVATESNVSHYIIQESTDGNAFKEVGRVNSAGDAATRKRYTYSHTPDYSIRNSVVYYRLISVDIDASSVKHEVKSIQLRKLSKLYNIEQNTLHVFPDKNTVYISDLNGQVARSSTNKHNLDVTGLKGVYIIILRADNTLIKDKIYFN